ncbi:MAG: ABC transporter permease [Chloroflexota bacterium]
MKVLDIALKDMTRSFRSMFAVIFMFGIPLLMTGMFYFMFGNIAGSGEFNLPKTKVIVANLDKGGPKFQVNTKNIPGGAKANTMGELVLNVLQSERVAELVDLTLAPDAETARAAVDGQQAQVALIIPQDFSKQFADVDGHAVIEFYQDPTLTIGPGIIRAFLNRFMDGMAGVKIAVNVFLDEAEARDQALAGVVVQRYLDISLAQTENIETKLLDTRAPQKKEKNVEEEKQNILLRLITPIMGGMMIFYAFFTGTSAAQSILKEEEERTLPRLFTTPTSQATILSGKLLAVFLTVLVQVTTLLIISPIIFGIRWGEISLVSLAAFGIICSASSFGIFVNSLLKDTKQSGVIFGGVLTVTGMLGMISVFAAGSSGGGRLGETVSLLVPQGWAVRGILLAVNHAPIGDSFLNMIALLVWSVVFFAVGVWRFNRRYV